VGSGWLSSTALLRKRRLLGAAEAEPLAMLELEEAQKGDVSGSAKDKA
jgi:hypothetical protein